MAQSGEPIRLNGSLQIETAIAALSTIQPPTERSLMGIRMLASAQEMTPLHFNSEQVNVTISNPLADELRSDILRGLNVMENISQSPAAKIAAQVLKQLLS